MTYHHTSMSRNTYRLYTDISLQVYSLLSRNTFFMYHILQVTAMSYDCHFCHIHMQ